MYVTHHSQNYTFLEIPLLVATSKFNNIPSTFVLCVLSSYKTVSADYIQPRCVDADPGFQRCDSGQLTSSMALAFHTDNGQSVNITQYEQVDGQYTDFRPIYKASVPRGSSTKVYLYHADGSWRLGNDYNRSTSAFGRVSDSALRPEFITGEWQIHYNGVWRNWNGKLRCRGTCCFQR